MYQAITARHRRHNERFKANLTILFIIIQLLSHVSASATQAYVDYGYTGTSQLNSYSRPYPDISSALEALSTLASTADYTLNNLDSEVIIKNGSLSNYSLARYNGTFTSLTSGSSLTIKYEAQTIPHDITSCIGQLPIIEIYSNTTLNLQADTLTLQNIALAFVAVSDSALSTMSALFNATANSTLAINNVCFLESGSANQMNAGAFLSKSLLSMNGNIFQRATGQMYFFDSPYQTYSDLLIIVQITEISNKSYLQINYYGEVTYNISITNISISGDPSDSAVPLDNLFYFYNGYSLAIIQMNISDCQFYITSQAFLSQVTSLNISNLTLNEMAINDYSSCTSGSLFLINNTETTNVLQFIELNNLMVDCLNLLTFSLNSNASIILQNFNLISIDSNSNNPNGQLLSQNNLNIINAPSLQLHFTFEVANFVIANINCSLSIIEAIFLLEGMNLKSANVTIDNSTLYSSDIFYFEIVIQNITFEAANFTITNNTFYFGYIFNIQDTEEADVNLKAINFTMDNNNGRLSVIFIEETTLSLNLQASNFFISNFSGSLTLFEGELVNQNTNFHAKDFVITSINGSLTVLFTLLSNEGAKCEAENFIIANSTISNSNMFYTPSSSQGYNFQFTNFTLYNNTFSETNIFICSTGMSSFNGTIFAMVNFTQWNISSCNFTDATVFFSMFSQATSWLIETERILVSEVVFENNIMNSQTYDSNNGIFTLSGIYARFTQAQIHNNQFYEGTSFVTAPDYVPNILIINSTIQDNLFSYANFASLNMSEAAYYT